MPSSSFVVNSEFQPMSYQELLHPVITQTQYQRELDEKYTQLDLQADKLEQLANSAVDAESYAKYRGFADRLREEANNLSKYGLRGRDSARFMELFRNYGKEIQPLLDAQAKRERLIEQQRLLSMQDPTSLYDRSAGNISLLELMANPSAAPIRQSGDLLMKQSAALALNLTREIKEAVFKKTSNPGYLAFKQKYGLSANEISTFAQDPANPKANRVLKAIYDLVMTSSGVKENWEGDAYNRASRYVAMGLWSAIGPELIQPLQDHWAMQQARFAHESAENAKSRAMLWAIHKDSQQFQKDMYNMQLAALNGAPTGDNNIIPVANLSEKEKNKLLKEEQQWIDKGYLNKNGSFTPKAARLLFAFAAGDGIANYRQRTDRINKAYAKASGREGKNVNFGYDVDTQKSGDFYEFRLYIRQLGFDPKLMGERVKFLKKGENFTPYFDFTHSSEYGYSLNFAKAYTTRINQLKEGYDMHRSMRMLVPTSESDGKSLISRIVAGHNEVKIYGAEDGKEKKIASSELRDGNNFYTSGNIVVDPTDNGKMYIDISYKGNEYTLPITKEAIGESRFNNTIKWTKQLSIAGTAIKNGIKPNIVEEYDPYGRKSVYLTGLTENLFNEKDLDDIGEMDMLSNYMKDLETNITQNVVSTTNKNKSEDSKISFINP